MTKNVRVTIGFRLLSLARKSLIAMCALLILTALSTIAARAQYKPIPNYVGVNAGLQFRADINSHLSGATPIAPRLVSLPFLQLPPETDGQLYWCRDCQASTPCQSGGAGAMALGEGGTWTCGGIAPLSGNLDADKNRVINLAPNAAAGDALSQGQSHLNDLATATGGYSMGANRLTNLSADTSPGDALSRGQSNLNSLAAPAGNYGMNSYKLTGLAAGSTPGDSLSYGQSSALLNGLNLNGNQVSGLPAASASGQAIEYAQSGAQLTAPLISQNQAGASVVSDTPVTDGGAETSQTIAAPASISNGNVLLLIGDFSSGGIGGNPGTITAPTGFSQILVTTASGSAQIESTVYCKVANNESGNYTISWQNAQHFAGGILNLSGVKSCTPDAAHGTGAGGGASSAATDPGLTLTTTNDFVVGVGASDAGGFGGTLGNGTTIFSTQNSQAISVAGWYTESVGATKALTYTNGTAKDVTAQQVAFVQTATMQSAAVIEGGAGNALPDLSASVNGVVDAGAPPYDAVCNGISDDSAAIQTALNTGKSVELPDTGSLCLTSVPLVDSSTNNRAFSGRSMSRSGIMTSFLGGPAIIEANPTTEIAAVGPITTTSHLGGGVALCWNASNTFCGTATGSNPGQYAYDVKDWLYKTNESNPLNGLGPGQLTVQAEVDVANTTNQSTITSSGSGLSGTIHSLDLYTGGASNAYCSLNIGGTLQTINGAGVTTGWHHLACEYDSHSGSGCSTTSCMRLYLDGAQIASKDVSGNIVQPTYDTWWLGASANHFPAGEPQMSGLPNYMEGAIDYFDVTNTALYPSGTTFTPPTSKPTSAGIVLVDGDKTPTITGLGSTIATTGIVGADSQTAWAYIRIGSLLSGETGAHSIHNMTIGAGANGNFPGEGVLASNAIDLTMHDLTINAYHVPVKIYNNSYSMHAYNLWLTTKGECGMELSHNSFFDSADTIHINNGKACQLALYDQSGGPMHGLFLNPQTGTANFNLIYGDDSIFTDTIITGIASDSENGAPTIANIDAEGGSLVINGGDLQGISPVVPAIQLTAGTTVTFNGTHFEAGGTSTPIFHWLSAPSSTSPHIVCENCLVSGLPMGRQSAQLTDRPGWVDLFGAITEFGSAPALQSGLTHLNVNKISDPSAPSISFVGATGSTSYGPYYSVCHDVNGGVTNVSPLSNTVANGNATLSASNYVQIDLGTLPTGCATYDVLKNNLVTALMTNQSNSGGDITVKDTGQSTTAYSSPTRNTTGDVTIGTMEVNSGVSWPLPSAVVNGASFYCPNCDPPMNPPTTCTSNGAKTGSFVHGLDNQWICTP